MSKCHVWEMRKLYEAIFADALLAFPTLGDEFEKDLARLSRAIEQRGIPVLLVDLPAIAKHLDRCLDNGQYKLSGLPLTKRFSNRTVIPAFCRGLYLLIFDDTGRLKDDYDVEAILFLRQIFLLMKKMSYRCSDAAILDTVQDFYDTDSALPGPDSFWSCESATPTDIQMTYAGFNASTCQEYRERISVLAGNHSSKELSIGLTNLDLVSDLVSATLGSYDYKEWSFKHGPGAISQVVGPSNKYYWHNWSDRLETEYPIADCGFHSYNSWADWSSNNLDFTSEEAASRLISVPKTYKGPRLIAAEPSENQWCQQNIWHFIGTRVKQSWISEFVCFTDQTLNQELCRRASQDGSLATVDLSAASDRMTCSVVGNMFRSNPKLLLALRSSRTRFCNQNLSPRVPDQITLRKFSTMGSACTFPVQTLVFLSIVISAVLARRQLPVTLKNIKRLSGEVAVFGDDIVIPVDSRELLFSLLEVLYFKVNTDKSFWSGNFRESCGIDAYRGVDVTPVYWRRLNDNKPESVASTVDVANNFARRFLLRASATLASTIRKGGIPYVKIGSGVFGFQTFSDPVNRGYKTRYNVDLQKDETLVTTLVSRQQRSRSNDDTEILQFFTEDPDPFIKWEAGVSQRSSSYLRKGWVDSINLTLK